MRVLEERVAPKLGRMQDGSLGIAVHHARNPKVRELAVRELQERLGPKAAEDAIITGAYLERRNKDGRFGR